MNLFGVWFNIEQNVGDLNSLPEEVNLFGIWFNILTKSKQKSKQWENNDNNECISTYFYLADERSQVGPRGDVDGRKAQ